jgi:type I restriction enzyme R subunit
MPEKGEAMPELSARQNIVVVADEAHRSEYGFGGKVNEKTGEMSYGFASNLRDALPNASFIGFTGTPIEKTDANTRAVFGDYISIYDIQRAVADKATVPIYYESRISKLSLNAAELPKLDAEFEEITEGEELTKKERLKTKWAALEALVGDPKRIALVAADLVAHFEKRVEAMDGKAMIVCMSRRICVDLYNALIKLRPEWEAETLKVVMTGSAEDGPEWQKHIGNKKQRRDLANQFKDAKNPFKIVIVRDMWLTGFDAPCLHTMYADNPMQGHGLMQAIARVNRVFRDKPGGLVVDYLGLADQLKMALITYTESGGQGNPTFDTAQAIAVMLEKQRHRQRHDSRLPLGQVDQRHANRAPAAHPSRAGAHPRTGRRQEALGAGGDGAFPRLRPLRRERRSHEDPRRRELLPNPASRAEQAEQQQPEDA